MLIAFDNARVSSLPLKWDMQRVLSVSSILALLGVVQSVGLLRYLHHRVGMEGDPLRTAMFMQLVIAGHSLLFSTRSRRFFFQPSFPEWKFFTAVIGTQVLAALLAANGWLMGAISGRLIGFIWVYNLVWLAVIDLLKVSLFHRHDMRETRQATWQKWFHSPLDAFSARFDKLPKAG